MPKGLREPASVRFWRFVEKREPSECWLWTGATVSNGYSSYGVFNTGGSRAAGYKNVVAHKFCHSMHFGEIPQGMLVMHSCDTPLCVNPAHLSLGTAAQNSADMVRKKRNHRGVCRPGAKLTDTAVREIRASTETQATLSARYGIAQSTISLIRSGQRWTHVI